MGGALDTHLFEEEVELGVGVGVDGDLKEGCEDVVQQLLKIVHQSLRLVDVVQPRNLRASQTYATSVTEHASFRCCLYVQHTVSGQA